MGDTSIEWTHAPGFRGVSWNPGRGCRRISPGCGGAAGEGGCYAERQAARFAGPGQPYEGLVQIGKQGPRWTGETRFLPEKLAEPLSWRKPRAVFVDSMSDLFYEGFTDQQIAAVFGVMAASPRHRFLVLTKRAKRMREWFAWVEKRGEDGLRMFPDDPADWRIRQLLHVSARRAGVDMSGDARQNHGGPWPLPGVWIGVSVEDQQHADEQIPELLRCPAAVRWVSYEPALGPVDFRSALRLVTTPQGLGFHDTGRRLDWIVVGGESGPGARPFDIAWAGATVAACRAAGVRAFFKQAGSRPMLDGHPLRVRDRKGGDLSELPEDLRVREWPGA